MIWFEKVDKEKTLQGINNWCKDTAVEHLDIKITNMTDDSLVGTMPITAKAVQPQRRLHGGVSCVLAESLGSIAANMVIDRSKYVAFGLEINANHLRPGIEGSEVKGVASPIHLGKSTQIWDIKIYNDQEKLICISRLTMAVVKK